MTSSESLEILRKGFVSNDPLVASNFAAKLASELCKEDCTITLSGDLGTGKTNFVKGLAKGLGVVDTVKSPSFNICSIYEASDGIKLVHIDAYRLSSPEDFDALLIDEIAPPPRVICVEWPENVKDALEPSIELKLSIEANGNHRVELA